jgi:hypothetical protein
LRALAVVLAHFAIGHTLGTYSPKGGHSPDEPQVFAAMQSVRFTINGFERSHWEFYRGFAISVGLLMFVLAGMAWSTASVAAAHPAQALALTLWLGIAGVGLLALSVRFFFAVPIVMSAVVIVIALATAVQLKRAG